MSIYRLGSDVWDDIAGYLDACDTTRLLLTGDNILRSRLKPVIRDFVATLTTLKSPKLSLLLSFFKETFSKPRRFSITLGPLHQDLRFVPEDYTAEKWETFFSKDLQTLELVLSCSQPPFSSLLACLYYLAPELKKLCLNAPDSPELPPQLTLPKNLTFLEIDGKLNFLEAPMFIKRLPTTLSHLKLSLKVCIRSEIEFENLPFRKMPLTFFQAHIAFASLSAEQACWSILPNTIEHLHADLGYDEMSFPFKPPPKNSSWRQLFPKLKSLNVPLSSLGDESIIDGLPTSSDGQISDEQKIFIRSLFPESLTSLNMDSDFRDKGISPILPAIGHQLREYAYAGNFYWPVLKWLPRWENPRLQLVHTCFDQHGREVIEQSEKYETFVSKKENHPISLLCRNATALQPGILPASAISFLPRSLTWLSFDIAKQDPLSLETASKSFNRLSNDLKQVKIEKNIDNEENEDGMGLLGWRFLGWPPNLTILRIFVDDLQPFHFGCLPATIKNLNLVIRDSLQFEGGSLAHLNNLTTLRLSVRPYSVITSLNDLPKSLTSFDASGKPFDYQLFQNQDFQNFFFNFQILELSDIEIGADILLYLPWTLKALYAKISREGPLLNEKHFEGIFRTKLAHLSLTVSAIWPEDLPVDVFSRFMPRTLAYLSLHISGNGNNKKFPKKLSQHIPNTLLKFESNNSPLLSLVKARIKKYRGY